MILVDLLSIISSFKKGGHVLQYSNHRFADDLKFRRLWPYKPKGLFPGTLQALINALNFLKWLTHMGYYHNLCAASWSSPFAGGDAYVPGRGGSN